MSTDRLTYCRLCEPMCGLRVTLDDGRVTRIRGDREHPLSQGWICRRGLAFAEVHNDPDRLRTPLRRRGGRLEQVTWEDALSFVGGRLKGIRRAFGPDAVGVYMGNPMAFCAYGAMAVPAFVKALGTASFFTSGSQDCNNKFAASERVFGSPAIQPVPDLDHVAFLLILGGNPAVSGMSFVQAPRPAALLRDIRKRGGRVVVVDPRRTETARLASEHLFIEPETDAFFLLSLLHVMIDEGRVDLGWADADPAGFEALRDVARRWTPDKTESMTGIPAAKTREIARQLSGSQPAACYGSVGINLGRTSTLTYGLILALNLLSGHFNRKGGSLVSPGVLDAARLLRLSGVGRGARPSPAGGFSPVMGTWPAALLAEQILRGPGTRIRALVVVAGNPLLSVPDEAHLKEALEDLDLLVCIDIYENETGSFADVLLPATDFLERDDFPLSHMNLQFRRYAAYTPAVVSPDGDQLPEWQILERLCDKMGLALWGSVVKGLRRLMPRGFPVPLAMIRALLRLMGERSFGALAAAPRGVLLKPPAYGRLRPGRGAGRLPVRLAHPEILREARKLGLWQSGRDRKPGALLLVGKRERFTHNTWLHNVDSLVRGEESNTLYLHPDDAAERGIGEGDTVRVDNFRGVSIEVPCRLSRELKPGVVALPHGWGHRYGNGWKRARTRAGVNVNRLMSDAIPDLEPITGNAWMNGVPVMVVKN